MTSRVLLVCTANICRSPAAQLLFAARVPGDVEFFSRGVQALPGQGICGYSGNWLATKGAFGSGQLSAMGHRARQISSEDVARSDLILTASSAQRTEIVATHPGSQAITYTLREAARIVDWTVRQGVDAPRGAVSDRLQWMLESLWLNRTSLPAPIGARPARTGLLRIGRRTVEPDVSGDTLADPHTGGEHPTMLATLESAVTTLAAPLRP